MVFPAERSLLMHPGRMIQDAPIALDDPMKA